jgi:hypothetical protein
LSEPKFKIGETVVVTEVNSLAHSDYIGRLAVIEEYYQAGFMEDSCDYRVKLHKGKSTVQFYANVREATEMDKALEGL